MFVVDASVAVKWFLDEADSQAARALLESDVELATPELLFAEVGNVLLKAVRRGALSMPNATRSLDLLEALPMARYPVAALAGDALALAHRSRLAFYDALYAALAVKTGGQLITADASLVRALRGHGLGELVRSLEDIAPPDQ